jgi:general secretion pathway protein E
MLAQDIGEMLVARGAVSTEEFKEAREGALRTGSDPVRVLIRQKKITESEVLGMYAAEFGLELLSGIRDADLDFALVRQLPIGYLKDNQVLPIRGGEDRVSLVMADPARLDVLNDLDVLFVGQEIVPVLCSSRLILAAINKVYGEGEDQAEELFQDLEQEEEAGLLAELGEESGADLLDETSEAPIIKLVNHILTQAVKAGASDIHIEPFNRDFKVRFRLDGVLYSRLTLPRRLHSAVVSRLKILAKLNIAEKRLPQDGRIEIRIGDRQVDLRVSTIPTGFGERVVLRLLEKGMRLLGLDEIGLGPDLLAQMERLITLSHGIVLVTGPTGSGKTTTLYAALSRINSPDKNILTIEDPVEYQIDGIGQMQVNPKIDLTFARGLRAMVRQDPDVILVGEIRDLETAEIAIQAALTGHLVFSTLHTNDAASAVTRLIDMGIEPFLVSSSVKAIIAQRLVRQVCPVCRQEYDPGPDELAEIGIAAEHAPTGPVFRPNGCPSCLETGYQGRSGIYEFMALDERLKSLILKTSDANEIRKAAVASGMVTLREDGARTFLEGKTTLDEVLRVTQV